MLKKKRIFWRWNKHIDFTPLQQLVDFDPHSDLNG